MHLMSGLRWSASLAPRRRRRHSHRHVLRLWHARGIIGKREVGHRTEDGYFPLCRRIGRCLSISVKPWLSTRTRQMVRREAVQNPISNSYRTSEGRWILMYNMQSDRYWKPFCQAIDRPDLEKDARFNSSANRATNNVTLIRILDEVFAGKTFEDWKQRLANSRLVWEPVQKPTEVINDPQARDNSFFESFDFPGYGSYELIKPPQRLSETPATFRTPAPNWGSITKNSCWNWVTTLTIFPFLGSKR